ncbi:hypothetical protein N3K66_000785 [Trichothecium roseum]|uniref:Uncharacterized protein n=1 Tax=Trichothecium roseum TaxID=47278 RepID=A0ACC0VCR9_9HYPO|nr:hypothetical protein N3K66_000785 [Trichothecium roseum]
MSTPITKTPAQTSIRSFFQSAAPKYAPPPAAAAAAPVLQPEAPIIEAARPSSSTTTTTGPVTLAPLPPTLPRRANVRLVTKQDTTALRRINALLLPVSYPDSFYDFASDPVAGRFSRVITWAEREGTEPAKVVGGVVCRLEPAATSAGSATLYIRSLCLLSPYRGLGLINAAVDNIIAGAVRDAGVTTVTAHVWTENEEGLRWYDGRGFARSTARPIQGYYVKLRPGTAWLMERDVSGFELDTAAPEGSKASTPNGDDGAPEVSSPTAAVVNLPPMGGPPPPPPPATDVSRPPPRAGTGKSYQNQRAETEWNDLPVDMATGRLAPPKNASEDGGSGRSSRSSSAAARRKRDRSYPAAAFGKSD